MSRERERLAEDRRRDEEWKRWGPYLSERQWGTVREDYSDHGDSWTALTHDDARRRAYRWGEDGLQGWCDRQCRICFAPALWNGKDPILKERLFGLGGHEGNHGEDVKECYYYLESTPTHSYTKALYKYPQRAFPYAELDEAARQRDPSAIPRRSWRTSGSSRRAATSMSCRRWRNARRKICCGGSPSRTTARRRRRSTCCRRFGSATSGRGGRRGRSRCAGRGSARADQRLIAIHPAIGRYEFHAWSPQHDGRPQWIFTENESPRGQGAEVCEGRVPPVCRRRGRGRRLQEGGRDEGGGHVPVRGAGGGDRGGVVPPAPGRCERGRVRTGPLRGNLRRAHRGVPRVL